MAARSKGGGKVVVRRASSEEDDSFVYIFDRRQGDASEVKIKTGGLFTFDDFKTRLQEALGIPSKQSFVIANTNREEIGDDKSWDEIDKGDTLYILKSLSQELSAPAQERVNYLPHYDTIVKGGMYEYYASEGQNPLPYAFAELIDNALAATVNNVGTRKIEIRLNFDDTNAKRNTIFIIDNGKGMTPRQLNNWAIYRLSKFNRRERRKNWDGTDEDISFMADETAPRSLNSDISYFGVGGKQAIFYIGSSTRMITKSSETKDVHELTISQEEFQRKETNHESIYSGFIRNRKPGDASHIASDDETMKQLISEEGNRESFTAVIIEGVSVEHIPYLKLNIKDWTRQLTHIYHYYIHGPNGNSGDPDTRPCSPFKNIDIEVAMYANGKNTRVISLRDDIIDDMQSQFVQNCADSFEFKATVEGTGIVEGVLRYHPFLFDRETYPADTNDPRMEPEPEDDHDYAFNDRPARGRRPIFECYWNGRLIPYTLIEDFDWCAPSKKSKAVPPECYNRISGVLWTNDRFQVSTNKLTFIDLELKLRDKNTVFTRTVNAHDKRTAIDKEFSGWLKDCHELHDKQVRFTNNKGAIVRTDLPRHKQSPWTVFEQIEWDQKTFKKGTLVRIARSQPMLFGEIKRFMLFGEFKGEVFATGGDMEVIQEPRSMYNEVKIFPLSRLDRLASSNLVRRYLEEEEAKLPDKLNVSWPEGMAVTANQKRPAGETIGDIKVEISNRKGELMSKLPGTGASNKKLLVELKIVWHSPQGDMEIVSHICQHGKNWPYWFRKMENIKNLGPHSILIQSVLNESGATTYAGKVLPSHKIKFTVVEGEPQKFSVGMMEGPFRVGTAFQIPLEFLDEFGNSTKAPSDCNPVLTASGLELSYEKIQTRGNNLLITGIIAKGKVLTSAGKSYNLIVTVPGLDEDSQTMKIRLLPGPPRRIQVQPEDLVMEIENGSQVRFDVTILDVMGNITTNAKLTAVCKFSGTAGLPTYTLDCSTNGQGVLTGEPISVKNSLKDGFSIMAKIELQGWRSVPTIEKKVKILPSRRVADIKVTYECDGIDLPIKNGQVISGMAGEHLQGLKFSVTDEAGRERAVNEKLVNLLKVNWTPRVNKTLLLQGQLSDIKVPSSTSDNRFCQILFLDGSHVEFTFTVKAKAGEPSQLKCKCPAKNQVRLGDTLSTVIEVHIKDKFGNDLTELDADTELKVSGEHLNMNELIISKGKGRCAFTIQSIQFEGGGIGMKEVLVKWKDLKDYVKVEVKAGPPTGVILPGWNLEQIVIVYNENKLPHPLVVQLVDQGGNPSHEADIKIMVGKETGIKFIPAVAATKTNAEGKVNFGVLAVTGNTGVYEIQPKAFLTSKNIVSGPKLRVSLQPDPSRPIQLDVDYDDSTTYQAGGKLTDFSVKILAEDENVMKTAQASHITMKLWKTDTEGQSNPPSRAVSTHPDTKTKSDTTGIFHFKGRSLPEVAGKHNILFVYYDGKHELYSKQIVIEVVPGEPVKLVSLDNPGTPILSNVRNTNSRCIIRHLVLELQDEHSNVCGKDLGGKLAVEIICTDNKVSEIPTFVGGNRKLDIAFANGKASLQNLYIQENSPGKDGQEYLLRCQLFSPGIPKTKPIPPFDIPFLFYDDAKKQGQMSLLSKERDSLRSTIQTYKSMFDTTDQLIMELKISVHDAAQEEQHIRAELRKQNIPGSQLHSLTTIETLLHNRGKDRDQLMMDSRRRCGLAPVTKAPDVIGKIGHLAQISESDIARVVSWHMSADMDCIVTITSKKAKEIYHQTGGRQQVLPLDSIFRKNLPDWNKPLPHSRFLPSWRPKGNPVYARNMLTFTEREQESQCRTVFGMLLGDVIILDTIEDATTYRQEIVKHTHCPTILTRDGDRIRSNGKFGGLMNKALPVEKLRGAVFGEPLSVHYHDMCTQIETLQQYKIAMEKHQKAKQELESQQQSKNAPEMETKYEECRDVEKQLSDVEKKLFGMNQPRLSSPSALPPRTRIPKVSSSNTDVGHSPSKRPRMSPRSSESVSLTNVSMNGTPQRTNGTADALSKFTPTPTRQSRRIAESSVSPRPSDQRKRQKTS